MKTHELTVADRVISCERGDYLIANNYGEDEIAVTLDEEWSGYETVEMVMDREDGILPKVFYVTPADLVVAHVVPSELMEREGSLRVGLTAYVDGEKRITTKYMSKALTIAAGSSVRDTELIDPTHDAIWEAADNAGKCVTATEAATTAAATANSAADTATQAAQTATAAITGAENVNATLSGTTLTVTDREGVSVSVDTKGEKGDKGADGHTPTSDEIATVVATQYVVVDELPETPTVGLVYMVRE